MRIKFSARAWMLSIATGLVCLPTMDVEAQSGNRSVQQAIVQKAEADAQPKKKQSFVKRQWQTLTSPFRRSSPQTRIQQTAGEEPAPRKLIERPETRQAIQTSKPASRRLLPSIFSRKQSAQPAKSDTPSNASVNEHLRRIYEKNGRDVPEYVAEQEFQAAQTQVRQQLPQPAQARAAKTADANLSSPEAKRGEIRQVSNNPFKRFFSKLNPLRRRSRQQQQQQQQPTPKRESEVPERVERMPADARREQIDLEAGLVPPAPISPATNPELTKPQAPGIEEPQFDKVEAPALLPDQPTVNSTDLPEFKPAVDLSDNVGTIDTLDDIKLDDPDLVPPSLDDGASQPAGELNSPFPSVSESKADKTDILPQQDLAPKQEDNPFTGLKLDTKDGSGSISVEPAELPTLDAPKLDELQTPNVEAPRLDAPKIEIEKSDKPILEAPALDELPSLPETGGKDAPTLELPADNKLEIDPKVPELEDVGTPSLDAAKLPEIKPEEPAAKQKQSDHSDKLQKIAQRKELKGLKGFCPVELRDNRDLKDALPQFAVEFEGVTYNLSSEAALKKFEKSPEKYAPAAGGQDVVSKADGQDAKSGSLDHAVWFKDRLYLFSSQKSLESFVIEPSRFAVK